MKNPYLPQEAKIVQVIKEAPNVIWFKLRFVDKNLQSQFRFWHGQFAMVGLPGERDEDIAELIELAGQLSRLLRVTLAIQSFVPKPGTVLAAEPMLPSEALSAHLRQLRQGLKGKVRLLPTSPRWSWLDWKLAHGAERSAFAAISAYSDGGDFAAWRRALEQQGL